MPMSWGGTQAMLIMPTDLDPPTGVIRDWIGSALTSVPALLRMRAALVTAELVDNARRYGHGPYVLHLSQDRRRGVLLLAVEDETPWLGAGWWDRPALVLVAWMSECWGVEYGETGKTVWAELSLVDVGEAPSAVDAVVDEGDLGEQ